MVCISEHDIDPPGSLKYDGSLDQLSYCELLKH
jgi:hypothetical protein